MYREQTNKKYPTNDKTMLYILFPVAKLLLKIKIYSNYYKRIPWFWKPAGKIKIPFVIFLIYILNFNMGEFMST